MRETEYKLNKSCFPKKICVALVADLHSQSPDAVIASLKRRKPDYILMPGDIFELIDGTMDGYNENGFKLMKAASEIAPAFYSIGNHENGGTGSWKPGWSKKTGKMRFPSKNNIERISKCGVTLLDDGFVLRDGIVFGGVTSGLSNDKHEPNVDWLDEFCSVSAPKILLCHHPEYYDEYLKDKKIDLIVSGHAHGGQWRIFGRGVYAPGQGIFPKYTAGVHDGRFVISRGIKVSPVIPRIFNPPEVVYISF